MYYIILMLLVSVQPCLAMNQDPNKSVSFSLSSIEEESTERETSPSSDDLVSPLHKRGPAESSTQKQRTMKDLYYSQKKIIRMLSDQSHTQEKIFAQLAEMTMAIEKLSERVDDVQLHVELIAHTVRTSREEGTLTPYQSPELSQAAQHTRKKEDPKKNSNTLQLPKVAAQFKARREHKD